MTDDVLGRIPNRSSFKICGSLLDWNPKDKAERAGEVKSARHGAIDLMPRNRIAPFLLKLAWRDHSTVYSCETVPQNKYVTYYLSILGEILSI